MPHLWRLSGGPLRHHLRRSAAGVEFDGAPRAGKKAIERVPRARRLGAVTWQDRTLSIAGRNGDRSRRIGKEYAVDRTAGLLAAQTTKSFLVNLGRRFFAGGLRRGKPHLGGRHWTIQRAPPGGPLPAGIARAGLGDRAATPGAASVARQAARPHPHPKTGWPVAGAAALGDGRRADRLRRDDLDPAYLQDGSPGLSGAARTSVLDSVSPGRRPPPFFRIPKVRPAATERFLRVRGEIFTAAGVYGSGGGDVLYLEREALSAAEQFLSGAVEALIRGGTVLIRSGAALIPRRNGSCPERCSSVLRRNGSCPER